MNLKFILVKDFNSNYLDQQQKLKVGQESSLQKKYLNKDTLESMKTNNTAGKFSSPPKGEITAPDAPWLKK